jgi:NADPH2:quinone reductase
MKTMRALRFEKYGTPNVLALSELPVPELKSNEVLVKVHASAINPSDVKFVSGVFKPTLPRTPGRDFAGTVAAGKVWIGQEVWGNGAGFGVTRDGSHAEYVAVPWDWLSAKPGNLTMEQAASVGVPYVTAWSALVELGRVQAGETVLITGASGAVGRAAAQIAQWKRARVIGADIVDDASSSDEFIDTKSRDLPEETKRMTGGRGADLVLDTVGGALFEPALKSLAIGGRQVVMSSVGARRVELDLTDFYHHRQRLLGLDTAQLGGRDIAQILDQLRPGFEDGYLRPASVRTWPLVEAIVAYEAVAAGGSGTKHVILPHQP